jgi:hypothetical protein
MLKNTYRLRYFFCGTSIPAKTAMCGTNLRQATQTCAALSLLLTVPILIFSYDFFDVKEYYIVLLCYTILELFGPILIFTGASLYHFSPTYVGYVWYTLFTLFELTLKLAFGLFVAFYHLDEYDNRREPFLIAFISYWCVWIIIRLYFNFVFFSFVKNLGMAMEFSERNDGFLKNGLVKEVIATENVVKHVDKDPNQYDQKIIIQQRVEERNV